MSAILKQQKLITWTIVTSIGWTIAASIQPQSEHGLFTIAQLLTSPLSIGIVGLMQVILIWSRQQLRSELLKMLVIQLASVIVLQVLILMASWFSAVIAIATLGKGNSWSSFSDASTVVLLVFGIVSHGWVQSWGFRQAWRDRPQVQYPTVHSHTLPFSSPFSIHTSQFYICSIARRTRPSQNQFRNLTS